MEKQGLFTINIMMFSIPSILGFFATHLWGALVDISRKIKPFILINISGHILTYILLFIIKSPFLFLLILSLSSLLTAGLGPNVKTYLAVIRREKRGKMFSNLLIFQSIGWILGAILGTIIFKTKDLKTFYPLLCLNLGVCLAAFLVVFFVLPNINISKSAEESSSLISSLFKDLIYIYDQTRLRILFLLCLFISIGNSVLGTTFSVYMVSFLGGDFKLVGFAHSVSTLLGILICPLVGKINDKKGSDRLFLCSVLGYSLIYIGLIFTRNPYIVMLLYSVPMYPLIVVSTSSAVAELTQASRYGGAMGILTGIHLLGEAIGAILGGLSQYLGFTFIPICVVSFMMVSLLIVSALLVISPSIILWSSNRLD
jgi:MFS family permease